MVRRQNRANQIRLRRGVNFIQMMLRFELELYRWFPSIGRCDIFRAHDFRPKGAAAGPAFGKSTLYPPASVTGRQALTLRSRRLRVTILQTVMALCHKNTARVGGPFLLITYRCCLFGQTALRHFWCPCREPGSAGPAFGRPLAADRVSDPAFASAVRVGFGPSCCFLSWEHHNN